MEEAVKLALIPPVSLLEYTDETYCQLMLPQMLENDQYNYTYRAHCRDLSQFVILDNGANEGEDYGIDDLIAMAAVYGVDELVLPDVIGDAAATRAKAMTAFKKFPFPAVFKYMYVLQGQNLDEFWNEARWALAQPEISTIAIPRHSIVTCDMLNVRHEIARAMYERTPDRPVHLLGGSPVHPKEIGSYNWTPNVRSHDTSSPFNFAYYGMVLDGDHVECKRPDNYFALPEFQFPRKQLDQNVQDLMDWTGNDV